jgi:phosphatidylinositol 4-kinase
MSFIVKAGDDIRQEQLAMQLIKVFQSIWTNAKLPIFVQPYEVVVCGNNCGLIETVIDASSIDGIKKRLSEGASLLQCFYHLYGGPEHKPFQLARRHFIESMVGYSIIMYLLQIKDRHNGNIMLMKTGHVVHIDFGFMLSNSPGSINFESAPFKLTKDYTEVIGSVDSDEFQYFKVLMYKGFLEVTRNTDKIVSLVEMMLPGDSLPCFAGDGATAIRELKERFPPLHEAELAVWVKERIETSLDAWSSRTYDNFQRLTNNIR